MLRLFAFIVCSLPLVAQSWDPVRALATGTTVKVRENGGAEHKGTVTSVTPDVIAIATGRTTVSIEKSKVTRVQVHRRHRRLRNMAIGAAIGVGVAVAVDQTLGAFLRNEGGDSGRAITYIAPIGLFGAIGAALSPYRTVYQSR
jgi:hypothetical protein